MAHEPREDATMSKNDMQSLLPARARTEIAAIPIRSLKLGLTATTLFCLGAGLLFGQKMPGVPLIEWIALGCIGCALLLGVITARGDSALLKKYSDAGRGAPHDAAGADAD